MPHTCLCLCSCVHLSVTPMDYSPQIPLFMEFSRQEHWNELPFSTPGYLPDPGIKLHLLHWQEDSLPLQNLGSPFSVLNSTNVWSYNCVNLKFNNGLTGLKSRCQQDAFFSITFEGGYISLPFLTSRGHSCISSLVLSLSSVFKVSSIASLWSCFHQHISFSDHRQERFFTFKTHMTSLNPPGYLRIIFPSQDLI